VVERIAEHLHVSIAELIGNETLLKDLDLRPFETGNIGALSLEDIRAELIKPNRDPRKAFRVPRFRHDVRSVKDLEPGMVMEGIVTNVIDFGAFVDIGVGHDGLVHLSEITSEYVSDPLAHIKIGDVVRVRVLNVDKEAPRISLTMKQSRLAPAPRRDRPGRDRRERPRDGSTRAQSAETADQAGTGEKPMSARQHEDKRRDRPAKRKPRKQSREERAKPERTPAAEPAGGGFNTLLADQLAALRDKFTTR